MRFLIGLSLTIVILGALEMTMMRAWNRIWWNHRWGRLLSWSWPLATLVGTVIWLAMLKYGVMAWWVDGFMRLLITSLMVGLLAATLSLPISGILNRLDKLLKRRNDKEESVQRETTRQDDSLQEDSLQDDSLPSPSRRSFLQYGAAAAPLLALSASGSGVAGSFSQVRVVNIPLSVPGLPAALDGFRILHLSDLHLGLFYGLNDLESLFKEIDGQSFDLVALVGDVADNLDDLGPALQMVAALPSVHGCFATLGNHEYYRGIRRVHQEYAKSDVPLLVNEGLRLSHNGAELFVGGADDPVRLSWGSDRSEFFARALDSSFDGSPSESFKLLLSHRPGAFDRAASEGIDLTLAGHTHGGQLGFMGESVFEVLGEDLYLWGKYRKGASQLYTSSGVGHWFPFRLGCPAEAPIITLRSS